MQETVIRKRTRDSVLEILRRLIIAGKLPGGARLEEVELSKRMGVSRTPLREALITLESEGWVSASPNKGVRVVAADQQMVAELYPILGALEAEAVRSTGPAIASLAARLRQINGKLGAETRKGQQHALDAAFHRALVERCGNARLLRLIETHWGLAARVDGATERGMANHAGSCDEHEAIIAAVAAGDSDRAASLLRDHWIAGIEVVTRWLAK